MMQLQFVYVCKAKLENFIYSFPPNKGTKIFLGIHGKYFR